MAACGWGNRKVEERLEDKAANVVADRLVGGASPAAASDI